ncbi:hypothetical protein [Luteipulveratus mongoliensis]|uniref:Uncharacterized protein n=1 Tax=Luteipulveratus mongoliensis TaxID=571913 RepID=A0A0K1JP53_9MICO|nr:hypothetical protein [Luteipulveratus mongoliensis]AKU14635.1 hypothetical protein VV02_00075 [Luteipulveratus mongoliensis]AKU18491.1 hypothetical protein VV02_25905 [Luteipulveratus mongoliensis]
MTTRPTPPAPRWIVRLAHISALSPVLSSLWRLPLMFGVSMGMDHEFMDEMMSHPFLVRAAYLVGLGVLSDGLAFLAIGLVRPWGEVFPRWLPLIGGRAVPVGFAATAALLGGLGATLFGATVAFGMPSNMTWDAWGVLMYGCYAPLALWGPTLLVVTADYVRRRTVGRRVSPVGQAVA